MARFNASNKIIVVHYGNVMFYPPVLNLLENLLSNHRNVVLIAGNTDRIPSRILDHDGIFVKDIPLSDSSDPIGRVKRRLCIGRMYKDALDSFYSDDDVVWTTTDSTVRALSTALDGKKHVLQLMELEESFPLFSGARFLKFDLPSYARKAWKVVVPEQNRAYIQQVMWNLPQVPKVLPNKPYSLDPGYADDQISFLLDRLRQEDRKIVMYLGVMSVDRNLGPFAEAVEMMGEDFALYVLGKVPEGQQEVFDAKALENATDYDLKNFKEIMENYLKPTSNGRRIVFPKDFADIAAFTTTCDWCVYNRIFVSRTAEWGEMEEGILDMSTYYYEANPASVLLDNINAARQTWNYG
ncbi:hypothetical protein [Collinsella aerofaciens]|uniref:hypothetical protein n=2 Tax=Coriobacteriaceae TaxID=84107 RepID=UPI0034A0DC2C